MKLLRILLLTLFLLIAAQPARAQINAPLVLILDVNGIVAPAMEEYIARGIGIAEQRHAEVLILQLNTPGGAILTMTKIVEEMRASHVPIVVYVSPRGGMAASAGTIITLAGHASAMAPETIIGAASPIDSSGQDLDATAKAKEMEALKALVRTIAARRSEKAIALAEATIQDAKAVSSTEALEIGLIDFIATDVDDLLQQINGFEVETIDGPRRLNTANADVEPINPSFIETLLAILTNPNIVFLLLSIGVQAILIEISSPGGWVSGFIGAVCLALAAYGMGFLPVNWFGIIFLGIAFALFILDVKAPTHGALTAAGIGSFIVGALVLFNSPGVPQFQQVSVPLVIGVGAVTGIFFAIIVGFALRAQKSPIRMGAETIIGQTGIAQSEIDPHGQVQMQSELWSADLAEGAEPIHKNEKIEVVGLDGLRLLVKKRRDA
jgi:membrane-bound serine protease (ClpP class)